VKSLSFVSTAGLAMLAVAASGQFSDQVPVSVIVDGHRMVFADQRAIEVNGHVLVPMRGVFERLGAGVDWDGPNQTVIAYKAGLRISLEIGSSQATVNDHTVNMGVRARIIGGSTMVPLRFLSEALGAEVDWDEARLLVTISPGNSDMFMAGHTTQRESDLRSKTRPAPGLETVTSSGHALNAGTVIPWRLEGTISSTSANTGDPFSARLVSDGPAGYLGIPSGTVLSGKIGYVFSREGTKTGVVELKFEQMETPTGQIIPVHGRLIALDAASVATGVDGAITARNPGRNERPVFVGTSRGNGVILALISDRPVEDVGISGLVGITLGSVHTRDPGDVNLARGTRFGLQLSRRLEWTDSVK